MDARRLLPILASLAFSACGPLRQGAPEVPGAFRWILIERRATDLRGALAAGAEALAPDAPILLATSVSPAGARWNPHVRGWECPSVEILELAPEGPLVVGETAWARLRVAGARPEGLYRIRAQPVGDATRLLGPAEFIVRGSESVRVGFTSLRAGEGTLRVFAESIR